MFKYLLITCLAALSFAQAHGQSYSKLVVFGNSLSDNGNQVDFCERTSRCTGAIFTDGQNAVENLADTLSIYNDISAQAVKHYPIQFPNDWGYDPAKFETAVAPSEGTNYAFSGAFVPPENQVGRYLNENNQQADPNALYVVFFGTNYVIQAARTDIFRDGCYFFPQNCTQMASDQLLARAQEVGRATQALVDAGAKTIIVVNNDDNSTTAASLRSYSNDLSTIRFYSLLFNHYLADQIKNISGDDVTYVPVDLLSFMEMVKASPEAYGMSNVTDGCFINGEITPLCQENGIPSHMYFDELHWTSSAHTAFSDYMYDRLLEETVEQKTPLFDPVSASVSGDTLTLTTTLYTDANSVLIETPNAVFPMNNIDGVSWQANVPTQQLATTPFSLRIETPSGEVVRTFGERVNVCITATLDEHVAAGRAYTEVSYNFSLWWLGGGITRTYYATGSDVELAGSGTTAVSLSAQQGSYHPCSI